MTAAPQSFVPRRPPAARTSLKAPHQAANVKRSSTSSKLAQFPPIRASTKIELAPSGLNPSSPKPLRLATPPRRTSVATNTTVRRLPQPKASPGWLRLLLVLQHSTGGIALLLGGSLLAVYGWTVYIQQVWGQDYRSLQALERQERQLSVANEIVSSQLAEDAASPSSGLVLPQAGDAIFLEAPAANLPPMPTQTAPSTEELPSLPVKPPQGY